MSEINERLAAVYRRFFSRNNAVDGLFNVSYEDLCLAVQSAFPALRPHEGWSNYPTWLIATSVDNNQATLKRWTVIAEAILANTHLYPQVTDGIWTEPEAARFKMADLIRDILNAGDEEDLTADSDGQRSVFKSILFGCEKWALEQVDYEELADHYIQKAKEKRNYEST